MAAVNGCEQLLELPGPSCVCSLCIDLRSERGGEGKEVCMQSTEVEHSPPHVCSLAISLSLPHNRMKLESALHL